LALVVGKELNIALDDVDEVTDVGNFHPVLSDFQSKSTVPQFINQRLL